MGGDVWSFLRNFGGTLFSFHSLSALLFIMGFLSLQASPLGGLKFHGSEESINQRTSYNVFGDHRVEFSDSFDVAFKLALYPTSRFGYLFRIKNKSSHRIYNLFYDGQGDDLVFKFNEEGKSTLITARMQKEDLLNRPWFEMALSFNLTQDSIYLIIGDETFSTPNAALPDTYAPIILFGKSDYIIDVPSFAIKDLTVGNKKQYHFALNESMGQAVHTLQGDAMGEVSNPEWLINNAYHWRHLASFQSPSVAGANYHAQSHEIYYFNADTLYIYNVRSEETRRIAFPEKCPLKLTQGTSFIDSQHGKLYAYETYYEDGHAPTVASLDLDTYVWTIENTDQLSSPLHHHGAYFNDTTGQYLLFGGFGRMHYSKDFFQYDIPRHEWNLWDSLSGDTIFPRYFTAMGYLPSTHSLYIFGGMGNESGEQTVGRKYYYDLHQVDLSTKHVTKRWEIAWEESNVVPVRSMVILDDAHFYTLCYPEHFTESFLKLYQFSLEDGTHDILGDSIPIYSDKIITNANLYYDPSLNNLYAVVQEFDDDIASHLQIYALAFPPITAEELAQYSPYNHHYTLIVGFIVLSLVAGISYYIVSHHRDKRRNTTATEPPAVEPGPVTRPPVADRANAVYLFGDFMVRDRENRDVTYMFSEQLKQTFCLILQHSTAAHGITSPHLSSLLWPDKPADRAKNSRGVTINHLRKVLGELDGIELVYETGRFKMVFSETFYCDYTRCLALMPTLAVDDNKEKEKAEFVDIVNRGKFLELADHPLFDALKQTVEKTLEPILLLEMEKSYTLGAYPATIALATALYHIDPLNDASLSFHIKALQNLRLFKEARIQYETFISEYKILTGIDYPRPYQDLS